MIENKCVNTLEPETTLAEMNKQGYRLVSAISKFQGVLLFFEREATGQEIASREMTQPQPARGKRKRN